MPVVVWMVVIFTASTDLMSAQHTSRIIGPFLQWLIPEITVGSIAALQLFSRKLAHLTEYAILGALLLRGLRKSSSKLASKSLGGVAFIVAAVFAASDEFHQSFVASRTGSSHDILIDTMGAALGLGIYWFFLLRRPLTIPQAKRA